MYVAYASTLWLSNHHPDLSLEQGSTSSKVVDVKRGQLKDEPTLAKPKSMCAFLHNIIIHVVCIVCVCVCVVCVCSVCVCVVCVGMMCTYESHTTF